MENIPLILQIIVALGILNVWLLRYGKATPYRGGNAKTLREEFATYGLPFPVMCLIGGLRSLKTRGEGIPSQAVS